MLHSDLSTFLQCIQRPLGDSNVLGVRLGLCLLCNSSYQHLARYLQIHPTGDYRVQPAEKVPFGLGLSGKQCGLQIAPRHQVALFSRNHPKLEQKSPSHSGSQLPGSASLCPLTGMVSLCSRKEHLWNDKPPFSREDGVDRPSDCGISLDLRVPHPSHCCASLLEVSRPGSTDRGGVGVGLCCQHAALAGGWVLARGEGKPMASSFRKVR